MPVMDGLQATRLIRSFKETGSWDDAVKAGVELQLTPQHCSPNLKREIPRKRTPIIAVSTPFSFTVILFVHYVLFLL